MIPPSYVKPFVKPNKNDAVDAEAICGRSGTNPRYAALIDAFFAATGVPMVLNTSFNENEPVVCRPDEALNCFLRTKMDVLVLGERYVERRAKEDTE